MKLHFEPLIRTDDLIQRMVTWYNDPEIAPFIHPNFSAVPFHQYSTEDVINELKPHPQLKRFTIWDDQNPIGELSVTRNFHMLINDPSHTAWISITIGEKEYWGKGIGLKAMDFLERVCKEDGYTRIELGVFEHNKKASGLYLKMGYRELARINHFTYSNGIWYADIRMEKKI